MLPALVLYLLADLATLAAAVRYAVLALRWDRVADGFEAEPGTDTA